MQLRDRPLLIEDRARAKVLWPTLGRPGGVLINGEVAGAWRPRNSANPLTIQVGLWAKASAGVREAITEQAERLAAHRQARLGNVDFAA